MAFKRGRVKEVNLHFVYINTEINTGLNLFLWNIEADLDPNLICREDNNT